MTTALIVCRDIPTLIERERMFREAGFETLVCQGPSAHECPRFWDQPCTLRDRAEVAVIDLSPPSELGDEPIDRICTATSGRHGTVVISSDPADGAAGPRLRPPVSRADLLLTSAATVVAATFEKSD